MYNREYGEGQTDVKSEGASIRRFSAQEHDTHTTKPFSALLWNLSYTSYIWMYLYTIKLSAVCNVFQSHILSVTFIKSR